MVKQAIMYFLLILYLRGARLQEGDADALHHHDILHTTSGQGLLTLGLDSWERRDSSKNISKFQGRFC